MKVFQFDKVNKGIKGYNDNASDGAWSEVKILILELATASPMSNFLPQLRAWVAHSLKVVAPSLSQ